MDFVERIDNNLEGLGPARGKDLCVLQKSLLNTLLILKNIFEKYNIKYFLGGGTLLGSIRHNGFIPWDDDIDIIVLRNDYEKLLKIIESELPNNLFFQTNVSDKGYHGVMPKIRINDTKYPTIFASKFTMHHGVFIDIFVHDNTSNKLIIQKLHIFLTLLFRSMVYHKWGNTNLHFYGNHRIFCILMTFIMKVIPIKYLEFFRDKIIAFYSNKNTKFLYDGMGEHLRNGAFNKQWFDSFVFKKFEGYDFPVPKDYDKYLTYLYGKDYMIVPKQEEQNSIHNIKEYDIKKLNI